MKEWASVGIAALGFFTEHDNPTLVLPRIESAVAFLAEVSVDAPIKKLEGENFHQIIPAAESKKSSTAAFAFA